ncbi:MAG: hypothetical protein MJ114_06465 [Acetatifactor sp.]|nr:hypothetical protein [Acetatifactor sp.]
MERYRGYIKGIILSIIGIIIVGILRLSVDVPTHFSGAIRETVEIFLYLFMIVAWGISMRSRVMHKAIRNDLFLMAIFMVSWVFMREIKWHYSSTVAMERILWYCFYIPMTEIPLLGYLAAVRLGRSDREPLQKREIVLQIAAIFLMLLVLTNDLHGMVFHLQDPNDLDHYSYGIGYGMVAAWIVILELLTIVHIIRKASSVSGKRRFLPLFFLLLLLVYAICYAYDSSNTGAGFIELMAMFNWTMLVNWETCVVLGMIPVNKYYREFFEKATINAQIVDRDGAPYLSAGTAVVPERTVFEKLKDRGSMVYEQRSVLQYHPISCGAVIWQEDITEIQRLVENLQVNQQELLERNALEEEESRARIRESRIAEKNRLYTLIYREMADGLEEIKRVAGQIREEKDEEVCRQKLAAVNVLGTYLKRRSNFIILSQDGKSIPVEEFEFCLRETAKNLKPCGMDFTYTVACELPFAGSDLLQIYDWFEDKLKPLLFHCEVCSFTVKEEEKSYRLTLKGPEFELVQTVGKEVTADE